jgi:hypothetical protein
MNIARIHPQLRISVWPKIALLLLVAAAGLNAQTETSPTPSYSDFKQQAFVSPNSDREGYVEFALFFRELNSAPTLTVPSITIPLYGTNDATMMLQDTTLYGVSFGMNLTEHININGDIARGQPKFDAIWGTDVIHGKGTMWITNINVDYNFLKRNFSPFVSAGVGFLTFDSGVPNGGGIYYWWDPYWGYTATASYTTHSSAHWTWNAAAGIHWDFADNWVMKASYQVLWSKIGQSGTEAFPQYTLSIGWRWY